MRFLGTYECGYAGCDEHHLIIADSLEDAEKFMTEGLYEYISQYEYIARRNYEEECDFEDDDDIEYEASDEEWYDSQDYHDFVEYCDWYLEAIPEEDIATMTETYGYGDEKASWEDIRKE